MTSRTVNSWMPRLPGSTVTPLLSANAAVDGRTVMAAAAPATPAAVPRKPRRLMPRPLLGGVVLVLMLPPPVGLGLASCRYASALLSGPRGPRYASALFLGRHLLPIRAKCPPRTIPTALLAPRADHRPRPSRTRDRTRFGEWLGRVERVMRADTRSQP